MWVSTSCREPALSSGPRLHCGWCGLVVSEETSDESGVSAVAFWCVHLANIPECGVYDAHTKAVPPSRENTITLYRSKPVKPIYLARQQRGGAEMVQEAVSGLGHYDEVVRNQSTRDGRMGFCPGLTRGTSCPKNGPVPSLVTCTASERLELRRAVFPRQRTNVTSRRRSTEPYTFVTVGFSTGDAPGPAFELLVPPHSR